MLAEFTKADRERLGELLYAAYLEHPETVVLPRSEPYTPVFTYLTALYAQASNAYRLDAQAVDQWTPARSWPITIIVEEAAILRGFPGGPLVISTGLLGRLNREHEIYHLFALEATLIHEGIMLEELVDQYGLESLELIVSATDPTVLSVFQNLAAAYPTLTLAPERLRRADPLAQSLICRSSLYAPYGLLPLLEKHPEAAYFDGHPSYAERAALLKGFSADCGTLETNGGYASEVLAHL